VRPLRKLLNVDVTLRAGLTFNMAGDVNYPGSNFFPSMLLFSMQSYFTTVKAEREDGNRQRQYREEKRKKAIFT
jgi:hypothetical protein